MKSVVLQAPIRDKTPPGAPTLALSSSSDTGSSSSDRVTNDTTPTLIGTAEAGSTVTIRDGTKVLGTTIVDGFGQWSFTTAALLNGVHSFTARATDAAGNIGVASSALAVTIDTVPPGKPTITGFSDDNGSSSSDHITSDATLHITGTAQAQSKVEIFDGASSLGTVTTNSSGGWAFDSVALASGIHHFTVKASDVAGNTSGASAELAVTVNQAPTAVAFSSAMTTIAETTSTTAHIKVADIVVSDDTVVSSNGLSLSGADAASFEIVGMALYLKAGVVLDYETKAAYSVVVNVDDPTVGGSPDASQVFSLLVNDIDLGRLTGPQGFRIFGADADDQSGFSASSAGDMNGDGFDDLIIGARYADGAGNAKSSAGESYVIYGKAAGFSDIDLATLTVDKGFRIFGADADDRSGRSVSSAGDVNGDGFGDVIIGASLADAAGNAKDNAGESYVIFGKATGLADMDLATLTSDQGFRIFGAEEYDRSGRSVASAGDVNDDGFDDLIIGSPLGDAPASPNYSAGTSTVIFGKAGGFTDIDLAALTPSQGFNIFGVDSTDQSGAPVSSAGDVNGDGIDDLIIGASRANAENNAKLDAGESYVVFGKAGGLTDVQLATLTPDQGFSIFGADPDDRTGRSVSSAGDFNGDGIDDLIVGSPLADGASGTKPEAGESTVIFGRTTGFVDIHLATPLASDQGFRVYGADAGDNSGDFVASAGDVNGDGFDDLIIGARTADGSGNAKPDTGESYLIFGKATGLGDIDLATLTAAQGFRIYGADAGDLSGTSVTSAGDINGDGFDDLIIGAYQGDASGDGKLDAGESTVIFGGKFYGSVLFAGTAAADTFTGTSAAESFVGGLGNDALIGNGGVDAFRGGAGNDTITVADLLFGKVNGGSGVDKLVLQGSGATFDFTTLADNKARSIEAIDFAGSGNNTLKLGLTDVLSLSHVSNADFTGFGAAPKSVVLNGDSGDILQLGNGARGTWTLLGSDVHLNGSAGGAYDVYAFDLSGGGHLAKIAVDADVDVLLV